MNCQVVIGSSGLRLYFHIEHELETREKRIRFNIDFQLGFRLIVMESMNF